MWHPESIYDAAGHLDEGVVHAWLDGQLAPEPAASVEQHAAACTVCSAMVAEARGLIAGASRV
nr:zf-HC2 domain-containing protein [Gemmatimonadaceae bacterium]